MKKLKENKCTTALRRQFAIWPRHKVLQQATTTATAVAAATTVAHTEQQQRQQQLESCRVTCNTNDIYHVNL